MFWVTNLGGYAALLNSFLDVPKEDQGSHLQCKFPHVERSSGDSELEEKWKLTEPMDASGFIGADQLLG